MATKRLRSWFTATEQTSAYDRFSKYNKPTQETFEDLFASVPFFNESDSVSTATDPGIIRLATKAEATGYEDVVAAVTPLQLPEVEAGTGISLNDLDEDDDHNIFTVNFDPQLLSIQGALPDDSSTDYLVAVISNVPKRIAMADVMGEQLWTEADGYVSPITAESIVRSVNGVRAGDIYLRSVDDIGIIKPEAHDDGAGYDIMVSGGSSQSQTSKNGGSIYLFGGDAAGAGDNGDTYIAYDGVGAIGFVGIRGAKDTNGTYETKIHGDVYVTGKLKTGVSASQLLVTNSDGELAASVVSLTELAYLLNVTSNIQSQLDAITADISELDGRLDTAEGDIDSIDARVTALE